MPQSLSKSYVLGTGVERVPMAYHTFYLSLIPFGTAQEACFGDLPWLV
jgi:hypothetical protein